MTKEEFYEKYIQSEDEKMMNAIHKNAHKDEAYCDSKESLRYGCVLFVALIFIAIMIIMGALCLN